MSKYWGLIFSLVFFASCKEEKPVRDAMVEVVAIEKPVVIKQFGFNLDDFEVLRDTVRRGDSFGALMLKNNVEYHKIATISENFRDTFDVRRIVVGKPYLILRSKDTAMTTQVFIYQNYPINYSVVDLRDSVMAYKKKQKVKYVEREASGIIKSSLSEAILEQGIDYNVTNNLSEIYAWSIDFFRLQKGDRF